MTVLALIGALALIYLGVMVGGYGPKAAIALLMAPIAVLRDRERRQQLRDDIEREMDS